jgi:hypothetical protein
MRNLSALSIPVAIALALAAGASFAQERPNTTLVQKSKATAVSSKSAKTSAPSSAQRGSAGGTVDAKSITPAATQTAPSTGSMPHDCHGGDADA